MILGGQLGKVIPDALPWVTLLPEEDIDQMSAELIEVAQGAASLRDLAPMAIPLEQRRHSAEVHADPDLYARLSAEPEGDLGPVPVPGDQT